MKPPASDEFGGQRASVPPMSPSATSSTTTAYVDANGVRTWYEDRGDGEPVVLLHGGFSNSRDFAGNLSGLEGRFRLLLPERRGHGHTPDVEGPITHDLMTADTIAFLDAVLGGPAHLVGYSDGATVATLVAVRRPDLVRRLVLISGGFHPSGWIVLPDADAEMPPQVVAAYGEVSPDGVEHFPVVAAKLARAAAEDPGLPAGELSRIPSRTLVIAADDDLVHLEHTIALYRGIPDSELAVVPGTSHTLLLEKPELCLDLVRTFLTTDAAPTMVPIRRAQGRESPA
jgi:pimeloyl-ACP methyl ester carboxylesterase